MRTRRIAPLREGSPPVPESMTEQESEDAGLKDMEEDGEDQPGGEEELGNLLKKDRTRNHQ